MEAGLPLKGWGARSPYSTYPLFSGHHVDPLKKGGIYPGNTDRFSPKSTLKKALVLGVGDAEREPPAEEGALSAQPGGPLPGLGGRYRGTGGKGAMQRASPALVLAFVLFFLGGEREG